MPRFSSSIPNSRYYLVQDDDGHWYLIPSSWRPMWASWMVEARDGLKAPPSWAKAVDNPSSVTFESPLIP